MTTKLRRARSVLATALVLVAGVILAMRTADAAARTTVVAYFDNSNGVFAGDDVLIRGVPVGKIVKIEPQPLRAKISFWFDRKYRVPADAAAAILSPQLVDSDAEDDAVSEIAEAAGVSPAPAKPSMSAPRRMLLFGLVVVVALAVLLCCWGFRVQRARHAQDQRGHFLQAARQCALNLTTIDWRNAEADVRRILDGATGEFYNDFAQRSQPFVEVLRHAKASTVGTITEAGLQTQTADTAQALVAVSVQTSNAGEADPVPRAWRMRITVQRVGDRVKVSDVGFVP